MQKQMPIELSIIMPCLNEANSLAICINKALNFCQKNNLNAEIIIADNGSSDGSQQIARDNGAKVITIQEQGYGSALMGGINAAQGKYIIMGDSDDSYNFSSLSLFLEKLREGNDLVIGNRFKGGIETGAMPFLHKYLGNPVLSFLGNLFFKTGISDFHCGLRGFNRNSILSLNLITTGMEFASEMIVKATLQDLIITEVPTTLCCDKRNRPPHLRTWRDGWRHLSFLLIYSPKWLFYYPSVFLLTIGILSSLILLNGQLQIGHLFFGIHTLLFSTFAVIIGFQSLFFYVYSKEYAISVGLLPKKPFSSGYNISTFLLKNGLLISLILCLCGLIGSFYAFYLWSSTYFGQLEPEKIMRIVIPSIVSITLGVQFFFNSFLLTIFRMEKK